MAAAAMNMQTQSAKIRKDLRQTFRNKRLALSTAQQMKAGKQLVKQFQEHAVFQNAQNVALYLSFNGEINTQALIDHLWSLKRNVFVPILHPFCKGQLLFQAYTPNTKMRHNQLGILEPVLDVRYVCPLENLQLILTPLVAFDTSGNRLGMGGGFYDRTLVALQNKKHQATVAGLAHELQLTSTLPTETWDIPLPYILTSSKLYSFS
ncbi:5-formyltetrahydrofolate cyclo-ligase [Brumicola nitratireducens]|uniref:5-formyltetrahydrofolate cyclo-ligase n=1 Tax=Glaciecola nitratireducens (strain JCM 12485 / KCTC 12276 / FR1064) TaxID=1085623 RepID=G4QMA7_GLANF|nr:5-formyltetrahydrofolate cyclo-ligase [Glaciecola nitratireducens]AEP30759.1 5-formyltetrahydrofolate cyclo-ligase [Glaciecola nitratireducens FR1064]